MAWTAAMLVGASPALAQDGSAPGDAPQNGAATTPQRRPATAYRRPADIGPSAIIADTRQPPQPGLLGDLLGVRPTLADDGISVAARYASETAWNYTGGRKRLVTETGQLDAGALFDLDRLAGIKGGAVQATITWRRGRDLDQDAGLGTLQQVQEVFGRGQTVRVTQLWYEQTIGPAVEIKVGRTNPGEDFAIFSCHFENLSFCGAQPGNLVGDYWENWPISQWGGRVHVDLTAGVYVQAGAYEINPRNNDNSLFIGHFHGATGALLPVEVGRAVGGRRVGSYKIGGWIATAPGSDVLLDVTRRPIVVTGLAPLQHSARYGVYLNAQQQLTGTAKDGKSLTGLSVFVNVTQADRATSVIDNQAVIGLYYKGLVPAVPGDVLGIGLARTNVNGRAATADTLDPAHPPVRDAEYAAEVYYSLHPLAWLELRPNLQWVHHPGGLRTVGDIGLFGMKAAFTL